MDIKLQTINQGMCFEVHEKAFGFRNDESHSENIDYSNCFEAVDSNIKINNYDNKNHLDNGKYNLPNSYNLNQNQDRAFLNINEPVKVKQETLENADSKLQDIANFRVNIRMDTGLGNIKQEVIVKKESLENNDYKYIFENTDSYLQNKYCEYNGKFVGKMEIKEEIKHHLEQNFKIYPEYLKHNPYFKDTKSDLTIETDHGGFEFEKINTDANISNTNNEFSDLKCENVPTTFDNHVRDRKCENSASSNVGDESHVVIPYNSGEDACPRVCTLCRITSESRYCLNKHRTDIPFKDSIVLTKYGEHKIDNVRDKGDDTVSISNITRITEVHSTEQSNQCQSFELRRHTPCNERPYKCNVCNKALNTSGALRKHMYKHGIRQRIQCRKCDKQFNKSRDLKSHMVRHSTERPHRCNVCEKGFKTMSELTRHMRIHSPERPHKCNVCDKGFKTIGELKSHMTSHSTERPHKCNVCDKGCKSMNNLRQHMKIHSTNRPHKCNLCDKGFKTVFLLRRHMTRHSTRATVSSVNADILLTSIPLTHTQGISAFSAGHLDSIGLIS